MNESVLRLIIDGIIDREGGYVNHPADRGGPTKFGITIPTLEMHTGIKGLGEIDIRELTRKEAFAIYYKSYVIDPGYTIIKDPLLLEMVVDAAVHSGQSRATKWLQEALRVNPDGKIGPVTTDAMIQAGGTYEHLRKIRSRFVAQRIQHLGRIITDTPSNAAFAAGWANRVAKFVEAL